MQILLYLILVFLIIIVLAFALNPKQPQDYKPQQRAAQDTGPNPDFIRAFHQDFHQLQEHYIPASQLKQFKEKYKDVYKRASTQKGLSNLDFCREFEQLPHAVAESNARFVDHELDRCATFFDNVEGKKLDEQQRKAIVTDDDYNLVIAGAGSGKTLTIAGKVKYLCQQQHVSPDDILLIAFTNKAAEELKNRIAKNMGIPVETKTFHKVGLDIISHADGIKPDIMEDYEFEAFLADFLKNRMKKRKETVQAFSKYYALYAYVPEDKESTASSGKRHSDEEQLNIETLQSKWIRRNNEARKGSQKTLQGEVVKSIGELEIANFLFINKINYVYERPYPGTADESHRVYKPDFYLVDYDIYLEHFGIDKQGHVPWLSQEDEKKYLDGMAWKRALHKQRGTRLIETYSWYLTDGILLARLEELLSENHVAMKPRSAEEICSLIDDEDTTFRNFANLCHSFVILFKSNGYKISDLDTLAYRQQSNLFSRERLKLFKTLIGAIMTEYEAELKKQQKIDFSDMINLATEKLRTKYRIHPYKYIIVDEYQDISNSRNKLLDAIVQQTGAHLMCVGDDWQSIFRFAGSDITLFTGFTGRYPGAQTMRIEQTYRNSRELLEVSSAFIMKNPAQIKKNLRSDKRCSHPVHIYECGAKTADIFTRILDSIIRKYGTSKSILILGRNSFDLNILKETGLFYVTGRNETLQYKSHPEVPIRFLTVHKSKGLEADNVILINFDNRLLGFPNKIEDDPMLELLLSSEDSYPFSEERRLMYVALTRTRNEIYLIADLDRPSSFAYDLRLSPFVQTTTIKNKQNSDTETPSNPHPSPNMPPKPTMPFPPTGATETVPVSSATVSRPGKYPQPIPNTPTPPRKPPNPPRPPKGIPEVPSEHVPAVNADLSDSYMPLPGSYVVIDVETTGWSGADNISEICALKVVNDAIVSRLSSLVNPGYPISYETTEQTGITNEELKSAPSFSDVLPSLMSFMGSNLLVGHNVTFDIRAIRADAKNVPSAHLGKVSYVDTLTLSRRLFKNGSHKLSDIAKAFHIEYQNLHRATDDAILTYKCYLFMKRYMAEHYIVYNDIIKTY